MHSAAPSIVLTRIDDCAEISFCTGHGMTAVSTSVVVSTAIPAGTNLVASDDLVFLVPGDASRQLAEVLKRQLPCPQGSTQ